MADRKQKITIKYHCPNETRFAYRGAKRIPVYRYAHITRMLPGETFRDAFNYEHPGKEMREAAWSEAMEYCRMIAERIGSCPRIDSVKVSLMEDGNADIG